MSTSKPPAPPPLSETSNTPVPSPPPESSNTPVPSPPPAPSLPQAPSPPQAPSAPPAPSPPPASSKSPASSPPPPPAQPTAVYNAIDRIIASSEFNKFCFFISLRTGCLIIGYTNLIANLCMFLVMIIGKDKAGAIPSTLINYQTLPLVLKLANLLLLLMFLALSLTCTILLLVGLHKYKRDFVKPFLVFGLFYIVLTIIMLFASFAGTAAPQNGLETPLLLWGWSIFKHIATILMSIYFVLVIRSYYVKMT